MESKFFINPSMFEEKEKLILDNGAMKAYAFKYSTGVCAIRVENEKGYFILLPYQGQQIWRAKFLGKSLAMKSMFAEPIATTVFLESYGPFYMHCGVRAMGVCGPEDTHQPHGELPVAEYKNAWLISGEDEKGAYIAVSGEYIGKKAFNYNYRFVPQCRLYAGETVLHVSVHLENLRTKPMTYMYLGHANFRPVDGSELCYSAKYDSDHIKVHKIIGADVPKEIAEPLADYMDKLEKDPALHHKIGAPHQYYDPEICFTVYYEGDENGMAHTMQRMPDGMAFYVTHPVEALPIGIRWMAKTGDEESLGMVLPATAEHLGFTHAKNNGQLKTLAAGAELNFDITLGLLDAAEAEAVAQKIEKIIK